jgi:hypothetical protein
MEGLISYERDDADHMCWPARGKLHLDHSCELICEVESGLSYGQTVLSHIGVVLMSKTYYTIQLKDVIWSWFQITIMRGEI